mmetsp:Transcript_14941/g.32218  ORF Transcript_14941/g.32218 Transcript_14941/m.32218 type:complete len:433 (+) Transcript_14941:260-1558(+)
MRTLIPPRIPSVTRMPITPMPSYCYRRIAVVRALLFICVQLFTIRIWKTHSNLSDAHKTRLYLDIGDTVTVNDADTSTANTGSGNVNNAELLPAAPDNTSNTSEPCALLFFGVVKDFKSTILPSIRKNIIKPNQHCDIFLYTNNLNVVPKNPRSLESGAHASNVTDAYLLVADNDDVEDHIVIESMESFYSKRGEVLNRTRKNFHRDWGECCVSHDNMIKQWNSIEGAWNLMRAHEKKIQSVSAGLAMSLSSNGNGTIDNDKESTSTSIPYYKYVGLFRMDVFFVTPIEVSGAVAVVAKFSSAYGYNDRIFYGEYKWAKVWATKRFGFIPDFEEKYMLDPKQEGHNRPVAGFHAEFFLKNMMDHYKVPVMKSERDCFMRVRSGARIMQADCQDLPEFDSMNKVAKYLPDGIDLVDKGWIGSTEGLETNITKG